MGTILNLRILKNNLTLIALYGVFLLFITMTNPNDLHIGWLLFPLVVFYLALYFTFKRLLGRKGTGVSPRQRLMAGLAAAVPMMLMGLGSIGQLTGRDLIIITAFGLVGVFYVSRLDL